MTRRKAGRADRFIVLNVCALGGGVSVWVSLVFSLNLGSKLAHFTNCFNFAVVFLRYLLLLDYLDGFLYPDR